MARIAERIRGLGEGEADLRIDEEDAADLEGPANRE